MTATHVRPSEADAAQTEHFDVLIVAAGISGVGSAYHLYTITASGYPYVGMVIQRLGAAVLRGETVDPRPEPRFA
jgi:hypothetical protein